MSTVHDLVSEAANHINRYTELRPTVGLVLGSGLGAVAAEVRGASILPYPEIPHFPRSTAVGHAGKLIIGTLAGVPVAVMAGRVHLYEGYTPQQATFSVRVLKALGVKNLILTNAAGGINPDYRVGQFVLIKDHINLQGVNPLTGPNDERFGPRFPDMTYAYSPRLRQLAQEAAGTLGVTLPEGVYAGLLGPNYETPAEIRYLRTIGADLVGMSTVGECIVANHMGMEVLGLSSCVNMAAGMEAKKLHHEEVLNVGHGMQDTLLRLLTALLPRLG